MDDGSGFFVAVDLVSIPEVMCACGAMSRDSNETDIHIASVLILCPHRALAGARLDAAVGKPSTPQRRTNSELPHPYAQVSAHARGICAVVSA